MPNPQEFTTADDEIRSIRVHSLLPTMDAIYLFNCFSDNAKVLAATEYWVLGNHFGFVEFASHSIAKFVLESYNDELMPNFSSERYCLSWDTDGIGLSWRWVAWDGDLSWRCVAWDGWDGALMHRSFFGYDEYGHIVVPKTVSELYKVSIPALTTHKQAAGTTHKRAAGDLQMEAAYPNTRLKLTDMHSIHCPDMYRGHATTYEHYGPRHRNVIPNIGGYDNYQQHGLYLQAAHTLGQLTKVTKAKSKEKELYLCFNEINTLQRSCYVLRTIKLSELLACSCEFSIKGEKITKCNICASKTKSESELRQRAWLFTGENVPASCGGMEARIPQFMGCCASDSRIFFAGGLVLPPGQKTRYLVPSADVYSFEPESCSWQMHRSFVKEKPEPLLFWVKGNLYCLERKAPCRHLELPTFEVYNSRLGECEVLPDPPLYLRKLETQSCRVPDLSAVLVGTKILIWGFVEWNKSLNTPIMCFDVNSKEKEWRQCAAEPFPFDGSALVLDVKDAASSKFIFSFRRGTCIYVSTFVVDDDGNIAIVNDQFLGLNTLIKAFTHNIDPVSHAFVDLGDQKVGFVLCGNKLFSDKDDTEMDDTSSLQNARVLVVVIQYEVEYSESSGVFICRDVVATRTFEYNYHSPNVSSIDLIGSFVV